MAISDASDMETFASVASAKGKIIDGTGKGDTFAYPILDDDGFVLSQSAAVTLYVGKKFGFMPEKEQDVYKAIQYMNDAQDFMSEALSAVGDAKLVDDFLVSGPRFDAWMGNIERSIHGPYYFGQNPTRDYLLQCVDWVQISLLDPLEKLTGNKLAAYPKVVGMLERVRSLPSFKRQQSWRPKNLLPPMVPQSEWISELELRIKPKGRDSD